MNAWMWITLIVFLIVGSLAWVLYWSYKSVRKFFLCLNEVGDASRKITSTISLAKNKIHSMDQPKFLNPITSHYSEVFKKYQHVQERIAAHKAIKEQKKKMRYMQFDFFGDFLLTHNSKQKKWENNKNVKN